EHFFLTVRDRLAQQTQPLKLAAVLGSIRAVTQILGGMVADLLEMHEHRQDEATARHAAGALEALAKIVHGSFVECRLFLRQAALGTHLRFFRQIGEDVGIGFEAPKNIGPDEPSQRSERLSILELVELLDIRLELVRRAEQPGTTEIEQRPEVAEVVLDRSASEHKPATGL